MVLLLLLLFCKRDAFVFVVFVSGQIRSLSDADGFGRGRMRTDSVTVGCGRIRSEFNWN